MTHKEPVVFEEFFELGQEESLSPFITKNSRAWGDKLALKASFLAAVLLLVSFLLSFKVEMAALSSLVLLFVYFLAGVPSLIESVEDLANLEVNIDVLMTLAAFSSVFIGSGMEGGLLLVLFSLSGSMEEAVRAKAKSAIQSLHKLSPTTAFVVRADGSILESSVKEIPLHATILVKSGQVVPLDGVVVDGISSVNLVHLTGENFPVRKQIGDEVPSGARNLEGALTLQVIRTSADSTLFRIIQLVTQAQEAKPRLQRWFDSLSRRYAVTIILLAFFFSLSLPLILGIPFLGREGALYRSLAFLIAASPCALIIALPIAYLSAISASARKGILLKGGISLDALAGCRAVAFDKTGTLTTGDLTCFSVGPLKEGEAVDESFILSAAYALERGAQHPIAKAIMAFAEERGVLPARITDFKAIPGYGLEGMVESGSKLVKVYIGNPDYISEKMDAGDQESLEQARGNMSRQGELLAVMFLEGRVILFKFQESLRKGMKETIDALKQRHDLSIYMLTGDRKESAEKYAKLLNIKNPYFNLKPEEKLAIVAELSEKEGLAMVGDGINDAPSLARATVGICMGKVGTTAAMDASDVILLQDTIELLDWLFARAKKTQTVVRQNLLLAAAAIVFASLPALMGAVPLWLAVVLHEGGTILVGLNALRLLRS